MRGVRASSGRHGVSADIALLKSRVMLIRFRSIGARLHLQEPTRWGADGWTPITSSRMGCPLDSLKRAYWVLGFGARCRGSRLEGGRLSTGHGCLGSDR